MAEEKRTRRSDRYAAPPERVSRAAERMQAEAAARAGGAGQPWLQNYQPGYPQGGYAPQGGFQQPVPEQGQEAWYAEEYARQQYLQQQYAAEEYARQQYMQQQYAAQEAQQERRRIVSETSSHGTMRGYTGRQAPTEPRNTPAQQQPKKRKVLPIVLISLLAIAVVAGGVVAAMSYFRTKEIEDAVTPYDTLFCEGVYVDGINLGGMTPEQAMNSVQSQIQQRQDAWKVALTYNGETVAQIDAAMLGMSVDAAQVLNDAWAQGHTPMDDYEARLAAMEQLRITPYQAYTATPSGDTTVIDALLAGLKLNIDKPAQDAYLIAFDTTQAYPFIFQEEEYGQTLNTDTLRTDLYHMVATMTGGTVELRPEVIEPKVRVADLQKHYMLRSSVYTPISTSSTEERNKNIQRAFDFVNGYVLNPGSQFSFNKVVGARTEANGFYPAIEYAYGEHVEGIGGGVCQASTTIYQAAVCAGLQIVNRKPHSDSVSYTDYGKDATVYYGSRRMIDLVFKNNTDEPIYMVAAVQTDPSNKKRLIAKVSMYGADMGDVRYEIEAVTTEVLEAPEEPVYVKDTKATYVTYTDQQKSVSKAQEGYVVDSYRVEYIGNVVNERVHLYTDTYDAKAEKIYVGTKKRPAE